MTFLVDSANLFGANGLRIGPDKRLWIAKFAGDELGHGQLSQESATSVAGNGPIRSSTSGKGNQILFISASHL